MNEIQDLSGKSLGYTIPSSFQEFRQLATLTNTPIQQAVKSILQANEAWKKYLIPMESLGGKHLGYLLSPEIQNIQSVLKEIQQSNLAKNLPFKLSNFVQVEDLSGKISGYMLPPEITKLNASLNTLAKLFANKNLNILDDLLEDTLEIADILQEKDFTELDTTNPKTLETLLSKILLIYELLKIILGMIGIDISPLKIHEYFASSRPAIEEVLSICEKLSPNGKIYSTRTVDAKNGLIVRKYDSKNSKAITTLADGKLLCVLKEPKDNARWILVASQLDDGEIVQGYVSRKFTKQLN